MGNYLGKQSLQPSVANWFSMGVEIVASFSEFPPLPLVIRMSICLSKSVAAIEADKIDKTNVKITEKATCEPSSCSDTSSITYDSTKTVYNQVN